MSLEASTSSSPKKRKHQGASGSTRNAASKKAKKDGKEKKSRNSRSDGQFKVVSASVRVSIPPKFSENPIEGAIEMLDSLVMRYVPALQGVLLAHSNAAFTSPFAVIQSECPFLNCMVNFDATVWSPQMGMKLAGKINLHSPDHVALLVHRTFNVSIPREHIPSQRWEFQHGPAENDPEFGASAVGTWSDAWGEGSSEKGKGAEDVADDVSEDVSVGVWVDNSTGERLGGSGRVVEFAVVGMTVANHMLSLKGSLQPDLKPEEVPRSAASAFAREDLEREDDDNDDGKEDEVEDFVVHGRELDVDSEDEDNFDALTAIRRDEEERRAAEKAKKKEDKAKRKEEKKRRREMAVEERGDASKDVDMTDTTLTKKRKKDKQRTS